MQAIKIHEKDTVAVALEDLQKGQTIMVEENKILIKQQISKGHKFALTDQTAGQKVIKYGNSIGRASCNIQTGEWVHSHNLKTDLGVQDTYCYEPSFLENKIKCRKTTFQGYLRKDGQAGIRNEIWIIPTVGCVNGIGRELARSAENMAKGKVDGIYCFEHPYGCSQLGYDLEQTKKILIGFCQNPNAGGILVLGLGCETLNLKKLKKDLDKIDNKIICTLNCQETEDEREEGLKLLESMINRLQNSKREELPLSMLKIGVKCGGSDGFSGITANPLVGSVSEILISQGASVLMTEVPEMFGAEKELMSRCKNTFIFKKLEIMIREFKDYYIQHQLPIYENPSPGNKEGGITTLEEKSLGCIQKGGMNIVEDIWEYGQQVTKSGLNLISGPGNDLVSVTALVAAGAQMILFTTGRGTPLGSGVPTIKVATNNDLFEKKKNWMDFNAGQLLNGIKQDMLKENLMELLVQVASGKRKTQNEKNQSREFAIFKRGVTL